MTPVGPSGPQWAPWGGHEKGLPREPFDWDGSKAYSRSPPMMPSRASRLWNTLKMSRYRARVALM